MKTWKKISAICVMALSIWGSVTLQANASFVNEHRGLLDIDSVIPSDVTVIKTTATSLEEDLRSARKARLAILGQKGSLTQEEEKEKTQLLKLEVADTLPLPKADQEVFYSLQGVDKKGLRDAILIETNRMVVPNLGLGNMSKGNVFGAPEAQLLTTLYNGMKGSFQRELDTRMDESRYAMDPFDPSVKLEDLEMATVVPHKNYIIVQTGGRINGMVNGFQVPLYVKGALISHKTQKELMQALVLITLDTNRDYYGPLFENILKKLK